MNSRTRLLMKEIQAKVKSSVTGRQEFVNDDAVIDYAVKILHEQLQKQRLL